MLRVVGEMKMKEKEGKWVLNVKVKRKQEQGGCARLSGHILDGLRYRCSPSSPPRNHKEAWMGSISGIHPTTFRSLSGLSCLIGSMR